MSINLSSPLTGGAQTGFTSPTYTHSVDQAPDAANGRQYVVTAVGGAGNTPAVHSASSPFTLMFYRPKLIQFLQAVTGQLSLIGKVPRNSYGLVTRKGVVPLAGQPAQVMIIRTIIDVPAGADSASPVDVRAAMSAHIGALSAQSAGFGDMTINTVI